MLPDKLNLQILEEAKLKRVESNDEDEDDYDIISYMEDLPYYDAGKLIDLGVYNSVSSSNYFDSLPDNVVIGENRDVREWFDSYKLLCDGIVTQEYFDLSLMRINKLHELYKDFENIKESGDQEKINARKQSILELGHNPEIPFDIKSRLKINEVRKIELNNKLSTYVEQDLTKMTFEENIITEASKTKDVEPVFIILTYTGSAFGKIITKVTDCKYSHAGLSFKPDLSEIFSFNASTGGFSKESISNYLKGNDESIMCLYSILVPKNKINLMKNSIEEIENKKLHYSFLTGLGAAMQKPIKANHGMICSQFVDTILKMGKLKIIRKDSNLVLPKDFYKSKSKVLLKLYEGPMKDYSSIKTSSLIGNYINSMNESAICVLEVKEFPVGFNDDGDLLIQNMKKLDFDLEYSKSHKLLKTYEKTSNIDGMKYELCKLWFMNSVLEKKIYGKNAKSKDKKELLIIRGRILNDFNRFMQIVGTQDKSFNFTDYYNNTPFSDAVYKINHSTLKYTLKAIKSIKDFII